MTLIDPTARTARPLRPSDELVLPMHKAMIVQRAVGRGGAAELRLYYAGKEIIFDEPELFGFAEALARKPRFTAAEAAGWGEGAGWDRTAEALLRLLQSGVLARAEALPADAVLALRPDERESPLPPAEARQPLSWADTEAVMLALTGRPLEPGYLELVAPIFRVAHPSLDAEGRQVGEGNVFPKALRLDTPTEWRTAIYPGSRYQAERPMNVTALKAMRQHWGQMMVVLGAVRAAYLDRFPEARQGWTVGRLERLATCVLALPSLLLLRTRERVPNGSLHPVLSNVFRVTDGLRMALHQMLFVPLGEAVWAPDAPITAAEIHAYAERNYSFHSEHGVCAGPAIMVQEFLAVLLDGAAPHGGVPAELDAGVRAALASAEAAIDYGLLGLQAYGAVFSLWPHMTRTYEALHAAAETWAQGGAPEAAALRDRLAGHVEHIRHGSYLGEESLRLQREAVYDDMYGQCERGLTGEWPAAPLRARLSNEAAASAAVVGLDAALARRFGEASPQVRARMTAAIAAFLARAQAVLAVALQVQQRINAHLGRAHPVRPFDIWDLDLHNRLLGADLRRLPYLPDELRDAFGLHIELDVQRLSIESLPA